jgi:Tfp pilus assembly protein PilN
MGLRITAGESKEELVEKVIEQMYADAIHGDDDALEILLQQVPDDVLNAYLDSPRD